MGYSRRLFARAYPDERLPSLLAGHEAAFGWFGGCPRELLYDNPRTLVIEREADGAVVLNGTFRDFAQHYGFTPRFCRPYRARTKGKIESGVKYVKRNFLAGRRFRDLEALNRQLETWLVEVADVRVHGTTHERPIDRFGEERLIDVRRVAPYRLESLRHRRVATDALVSFEGNRYSVPWRYVGRSVEIRLVGEEVLMLAAEEIIARHPRLAGHHGQSVNPAHYQGLFRSKGTVTDPLPPHASIPQHDPRWPAESVMVRDLAIYDQVAGLSEGRTAP